MIGHVPGDVSGKCAYVPDPADPAGRCTRRATWHIKTAIRVLVEDRADVLVLATCDQHYALACEAAQRHGGIEGRHAYTGCCLIPWATWLDVGCALEVMSEDARAMMLKEEGS